MENMRTHAEEFEEESESDLQQMLLSDPIQENPEMILKEGVDESAGEIQDDPIFLYQELNFYADADFPSLSICSSSSLSTRCSSASSSSSNSLAKITAEIEEGIEKQDAPDDLGFPDILQQPPEDNHPSVENDGMDVLDSFGQMGLLDARDMWDPATLFPENGEENNCFQQEEHQQLVNVEDNGENKPSEDLAMIFFEWLKSNKESISPDDLRSIKLKRSTIECAAKRLGGGKEGMMQLLKLILTWVQNHHLQKKRNREQQEGLQYQLPFQSQQKQPFPVQVPYPNPNPMDASNPYCNANSTYLSNPSTPPYPPPIMGNMPDSCVYPGAMPSPTNNNFSPSPDYQMTETTHFSSSSQYPSYSDPATSPQFFPNQYITNQMFPGHGERFLKMGSSATKEARKKRMARQKRVFSHHHHIHHRNQNHHPSSGSQHSRLAVDSICAPAGQNNSWSISNSSSASSTQVPMLPTHNPLPVADPTATQQRQLPFDRRQGWKPEKNIRFLLQKVLKQSDVGNLGRIVLPKKEAEIHLPELDARDGIPIAMEDIGTSQVWNMRYRFWPNNKSRMYLLENTGDFVRSNGLQEGDFIVLYSDLKCSKYMIRGVKVREQEVKSNAKGPGKTQKNMLGAPSSSAMETAS